MQQQGFTLLHENAASRLVRIEAKIRGGRGSHGIITQTTTYPHAGQNEKQTMIINYGLWEIKTSCLYSYDQKLLPLLSLFSLQNPAFGV